MFIEYYRAPIGQPSLHYDEQTIGLVVKTPEEYGKDNVAGVYIPRLMFGLPISNGLYENTASVSYSKCLNSKNKKIGDSSIKIKNYVTLQITQSNNVIPPKYAKGENVFVGICDRDLKNMYILPYGFGEVNRRKDDIWSVMCPNLTSYSEPQLTLDNTYGIQIDTKNKLISIWTSFEDGKASSANEKGQYFIGLNPKEGSILISDSGKRTIEINSDEDRITLQNEAMTKIEEVKDTINLKAKHINIEAEEDINVKSDTLNREHTDIKTKSSTNTEETDTLDIKGNEFSCDYNTTKLKSSEYSNETSKAKIDSPISGFSGTLTSKDFSISSLAGEKPLPTSANISNAGIATMGSPNTMSMGLTRAMPLTQCLIAIASKVDAVASAVGCPPSASAAVAAAAPTMVSPSVMG